MNTAATVFAAIGTIILIIALVQACNELADAESKAAHYKKINDQLREQMREQHAGYVLQLHEAGLRAEAHRRTVEGYEHVLAQMRRHVVTGVPHASRLVEWRN